MKVAEIECLTEKLYRTPPAGLTSHYDGFIGDVNCLLTPYFPLVMSASSLAAATRGPDRIIGVDPGGEREISPIRIPGREYIFAPQCFSVSVVLLTHMNYAL